MAKSGTPRSEIFYTTKLKHNLGYDHAKKAIRKSLKLAGLDYMYVRLIFQYFRSAPESNVASDLYLIHAPYPSA